MLPVSTSNVLSNKRKHWVQNLIADEFSDFAQTNRARLLHSSLLVFFIVVLKINLNDVLKH